MFEMTKQIEIRIIDGEQKGRAMHSGLIKAKFLADTDVFRTDIFDQTNNPEGYQRIPNQTRVQAFQRFIETENMFSPTSILLNIRENAKIKIEHGKILLDEGAEIWIVDGQHRVEGIRKLLDESSDQKYQNMDIPVIITQLKNKFEEAILFAIFNKTQMGIRYDLVEEMLNNQVQKGNTSLKKLMDMYDKAGMKIFKEIDIRLDAVGITHMLNDKPGNPWHNMVIFPNEGRITAKDKIIKMRSFTTSLEPLIINMRDNLSNVDTDLIVKHLEIFWIALSKVMPMAFGEKDQYSLQKSTGVAVLHSVYPKILTALTGRLDPPKLNEFEEGLKEIRLFAASRDPQKNFLDAAYWNSDTGRGGTTGTSYKAFSILEREIRELIDEYARSKNSK